MRILTVRQPWAHAIIHGHKDVENRQTNVAGAYRGPVAIHAALQRDDRGWVQFGGYALTNTMNRGRPDAVGAIIGVVELVDVHRVVSGSARAHCETIVEPTQNSESGACSQWAELGALHLVLANPRALVEPIPYRGMLGLRTLDDQTIARIEAAIA